MTQISYPIPLLSRQEPINLTRRSPPIKHNLHLRSIRTRRRYWRKAGLLGNIHGGGPIPGHVVRNDAQPGRCAIVSMVLPIQIQDVP